MTLFNKSSLWLLAPLAGYVVMPTLLVRLPEVTTPSESKQAAPAGVVVPAAYEEALFGHT